jgi:hypothetical protein
MKSLISIFLFASLLLASCSKDNSTDPNNGQRTLEIKTVSNFNASGNGTGQQGGNITGVYSYFSFSTGQRVPASDSLTQNWDIAIRGTSILTNSGISGPGSVGVNIKNALFDEVKEADETGYKSDTQTLLAFPSGSGNGWYNYNQTTSIVTPIPGKVFVIKTTNGKYAKLEILNYYKDAPANPTSADTGRYYNFRYVYQANGSRTIY